MEEVRAGLPFSVIIFIGPPLAGKGTQAALLSQALGIPTLSSGDLFRAEVASGSALGHEMKKYMDAGQLIPNNLTTELLTKTLQLPKYHGGVIMDGYPRNPSHLVILEEILATLDRKILTSFSFDVPKEVLLSRVAGRLWCPSCGATYNSHNSTTHCTNTSCASPAALKHRADDNVAVFERRYAVFHDETIPLIEVLQKRGLLHSVPHQSEASHVTQWLVDQLKVIICDINNSGLSAYDWLDKHLNLAVNSPSTVTINEAILKEFRDRALKENICHRSGIVRRFVYNKTTNIRKHAEHCKLFESLYGVEVLRVQPSLTSEQAHALLSIKTQGLVALAVLREESQLCRPGSRSPSSCSHGVAADNVAELHCQFFDKTGEFVIKTYVYTTPGHIDLKRRREASVGVFGWDDIFVVAGTGRTYHELFQCGIKHSSRDMVISQLIKDNIHYSDLLNLSSQNKVHEIKRPIDFHVSVSSFVERNKYYNLPSVKECGFYNLLSHVLNRGVFFRCAKNRRQNNYWNPGANGGIPLTKKADEIHEVTFLAHDFGHFSIPDLLFVGTNSWFHRIAYISWRMASEALTMALADMLFVDALAQGGVEYDFAKRRIYPLYKALGVNFRNPDNLVASKGVLNLDNVRQVIRANYHYCLRGDDSLYTELIKEATKNADSAASIASLASFKEKFMPFFVEDFRWTEANWHNMVGRSEELSRWWKDTTALRTAMALPPESVDDFLAMLQEKHPDAFTSGSEAFIECVFETVFDTKIVPALSAPAAPLPEPVRLLRGFSRWMCAQLAICSKYHFVPESATTREQIMSLLIAKADNGITIEEVDKIRTIYEQYLSLLANRNLISEDDCRTFAEVYPLFDPFFISYDRDLSEYEDLAKVSKRIFSPATHRNWQLSEAEKTYSRPLTPSERNYMSIMSDMIEAGDGQIQDGIFVTRPGVLLLTNAAINNDPKSIVTFLLAGVALESAMELVAHGEAKVARLTSSKTAAMNSPMFRIQGEDNLLMQKLLIKDIITAREGFENTWKPRTAWGKAGTELFNLTAPGCKATALCYTARLGDLHNILLGRMNTVSNELEVIDVVARMADILHALHPQVIQPASWYRIQSNLEKYKAPTASSSALSVPATNKLCSSSLIVAHTTLTPQAKNLFSQLNLCSDAPEYALLSEFRSRLTYLAFPKSKVTSPEETSAYLNKVAVVHGHLSIIAAYQLIVAIPQESIAHLRDSVLGSVSRSDVDGQVLVSPTMKELWQIFIGKPSSDSLTSVLRVIAAEAQKEFPALAPLIPDF